MNPTGRTLPHSLDAERSVLGGVLLDAEILADIEGTLTPGDFYRPSHGRIFEAMTQLSANNMPIDLVTLTEYLKDRDELDAVGGVDYLAGLDAGVPTASHAVSYASIIQEKAVLRRLIQAAADIQTEGLDSPSDIKDFLDRAESLVFGVTQEKQDRTLVPVSSVAPEAFKVLQDRFAQQSDITGVSTGYLDLDKKTAGLQRGDLLILAARPSMGKTALALNLVANAALRAEPRAKVAVFSLEMTTISLVMRLLSAEGRVRADFLRTGKIPSGDWNKLGNAAERLSGAGIHIDDTPSITLTQVRSKCRRMKAKHGLDLIVIDYLQLMRGPRSDSREQEIASISRGLKELAKELEVPVLALSQLNRGVEQRKDKRPMMSDLRESGAIEQDADIIMFIHREDRNPTEGAPSPEREGIAEVIIAKQRNGPTGTVELIFFEEFTRFDNYDRHTHIP
ncbi:MAG: replicative DNA helicase [Deltaproteobacteria bacterium]|nr:replicative DNA helicase [Deltaproteobacteria bacterium]